jgi:hypothetical protein
VSHQGPGVERHEEGVSSSPRRRRHSGTQKEERVVAHSVSHKDSKGPPAEHREGSAQRVQVVAPLIGVRRVQNSGLSKGVNHPGHTHTSQVHHCPAIDTSRSSSHGGVKDANRSGS